MDWDEKKLTAEFEQEVAFELLVLPSISNAETSYQGSSWVTYDLRRLIPGIVFSAKETFWAEAVKKALQPFRFLVFGAAYKVLDLFVEFILKLNGEKPTDKNGNPKSKWDFSDKNKLVRKKVTRLPIVLDPTDGIWARLAELYISLQEARHCIVHRCSWVDPVTGSLIVYKYGKDGKRRELKPITLAEQDKFAEVMYLISEAVIRGELSGRRKNVVLSMLDLLKNHHGQGRTGIVAPNSIPVVQVNLLPAQQWFLDVKAVRDYLVQHHVSTDVVDIELYRPDEDSPAFLAELEALSGDVLEFSEDALPCGVRAF